MAESTFSVTRTATFTASAEKVYGLLSDFSQWRSWSPWEGIDPDLKREYSGPQSGVGAFYSWQGNRKVGSGSMKITDAVEPKSVTIALNFLKPFKAENTTLFSIEPTGDQVTVTWTMTGKKTLMSRIMGLFFSMEKYIGNDFEKGLAKLKTVVEA